MSIRTGRMNALLSALLLAGSLAACGGEPTGPSRERLQDSLVAERRRWRDQKVADYTYNLQLRCFCSTPGDVVVVEVKDGEIVSITRESDHLQLATSQYPMIRSVEGLFDIIQKAIDDQADTIFARFDSKLHYPTEIQIDWKTSTTDDELSYVASSLQATTSP